MPSEAGNVTEALEARVRVRIIGGLEVECTVDTGFTGALVLPSEVVLQLGLPVISHEIFAMVGDLEDSADVVLAQIEWLGEVRRVDVIVTDDYLIGTELLAGTRLTIDYVAGTIKIDKL